LSRGDQFHRGADQLDVVGRQIFAEVERTRRQFQLVEVGIAPDVGVGLAEIEQLHLRRVDQVAQGLNRGGIAHEENRVEFPRYQGGSRGVGVEVGENRWHARDAIRLEQLQGEGARGAAVGADRDPLSGELGQ